MTKYLITYSVELDVPEGKSGEMEAYYWHFKTLQDSSIELPEYVQWIKTLPDVREDK